MAFRNIILPKDGHANPIENDSMNQIPRAGYFKSFEAGAGSKTMKMDERGMWMGSEDFETAPFSVDMNGNIKIVSTDSDGGYILINAELNQILLNDGVEDRILIGKQVGGF